MPRLVLGPLLRHVTCEPAGGSATIWVETDEATSVEVRAGEARASSRTFCVAGHHYALVVLAGLPAGEWAYTVHLDEETVWPALPEWPASTIRVREPGGPVRLTFGSCRSGGPVGDTTKGVDALAALAERMRREPERWPDELLLLGDQVYADESITPETKAYIQSQRDTTKGAGEQVANFQEYTRLYQEAWNEEPIRWLLSAVPSAMIFDDHDIHDDWNTSEAWRRQMQATSWWQDRIEGGLMSYWIYQHLGNLSPAEVQENELLAALQEDTDGEERLREFARAADQEAEGGGPIRWSYRRDLGTARLLVLDSRCGRVLGEGRREMFDEAEWEWLEGELDGEHDHLLLATSLPYLLPRAVHHLEAFDEALAGGAWGERAGRVGEALRQGADLEHWAAFGKSFSRMDQLVQDVATGEHGPPPASVTFLSGDVHFTYVAELQTETRTRVNQVVCSPMRNEVGGLMKLGQRVACTQVMSIGMGLLARAVGARRPERDWEIVAGPAYGNSIATLELDGRRAVVTVEGAKRGPRLQHTLARVLAWGSAR